MWALRPPAAATLAPPLSSGPETRVLIAACALAAVVAMGSTLPQGAAAVLGVAAIHGGLIAVALTWSGVTAGGAVVVVALLAVARTLTAMHPVGAVAYLAVPLWLARLAAAGGLARLGLARPYPWDAAVVGGLAGGALALHLFTCASRTLGYGIHFAPALALPAFAYDLGANVVSAELFFRGMLLQRLWRRWSFGVALAAASAAAALRYCVDPFVATTELRVGAAAYMTMLAIVNGVLYRWSGSLLPGVVAATVFFACYRLLASA